MSEARLTLRPSALTAVTLAVATDTRAIREAAAIGGMIALDAMFGGLISDASMNPIRPLGPALVSGDLHLAGMSAKRAPPLSDISVCSSDNVNTRFAGILSGR
jgi:Major intrinsic protein